MDRAKRARRKTKKMRRMGESRSKARAKRIPRTSMVSDGSNGFLARKGQVMDDWR